MFTLEMIQKSSILCMHLKIYFFKKANNDGLCTLYTHSGGQIVEGAEEAEWRQRLVNKLPAKVAYFNQELLCVFCLLVNNFV